MKTTFDTVKKAIGSGNTAIGIELGSTRIKAVLIGEDHKPIASGSHDWENSYINNIWTYSLDEIWKGVQDSYQKLAANVNEQYGIAVEKTGALGFSAMMHGYMVLKNVSLLRTYATISRKRHPEALTGLFSYPIHKMEPLICIKPERKTYSKSLI